MNSFFVDKNCINGENIEISDSVEINHAKNVLRITEGDTIRVADGEYEYIAVVEEISKSKITCRITEKKDDMYSLNTKIDAAISVIKNDKMDIVVQKLSEIGIDTIIPVMAKRSVVKLSEKKDKWDKIVKETMKQCGGIKPTKITDVAKLAELEISGYDMVLVPYEGNVDFGIFEALRAAGPGEIKKILYIIGPEGGFDVSEIKLLTSKGAKAVTLGKRILRAETAAIVVGGILANELS